MASSDWICFLISLTAVLAVGSWIRLASREAAVLESEVDRQLLSVIAVHRSRTVPSLADAHASAKDLGAWQLHTPAQGTLEHDQPPRRRTA